MAFVPGPQATAPMKEHYPPNGILTPALYRYYIRAVGLGRPEVQSVKCKYDYVSGNMFAGLMAGMMAVCVIWETHPAMGMTGTPAMMHLACAKMFFHCLDADVDTKERFKRLDGVINFLGRPQGGPNAGWFKNVQYAKVGECIDLAKFWVPGYTEGGNVFNWQALSQSPYAFLINRPDVFPRFFLEVDAKRTGDLKREPDIVRSDRITTLPMDIVGYLLRFFDEATYVKLVATCRFLRFHALTTFQPHARRLVFALGWAAPVPAELEDMDDAQRGSVVDEDTPQDADWLLYLSHVHRTKGMRMRRWIWAQCMEIRRVYEHNKETVDPSTLKWMLKDDVDIDFAYELCQMDYISDRKARGKAIPPGRGSKLEGQSTDKVVQSLSQMQARTGAKQI